MDMLSLDVAARRATWRGREVHLSTAEWRLTYALTRSAGAITYRQLADVVYGPGVAVGGAGRGFQSGERVNVRGLVRNVRRRLQSVDPEGPDAIQNVPGVGYRLRDGATL